MYVCVCVCIKQYLKTNLKTLSVLLSETETIMSATDDNGNGNGNVNHSDTPVSSRLTGRVKWFNNKTGFGFITALTDSDGIKEGSDIFVHHSSIKVAQEQYRYLVQGEYLEFELSKIADSSNKHEFQAANVSGVKGGKLICETRWESRLASGGQSRPVASGASRFKPSEKPAAAAAAAAGDWTTVGGSRKTTAAFTPRQSGGQWRRGSSTPTRGGRGGSSGSGASE